MIRIKRRDFLKGSLAAGAGLFTPFSRVRGANNNIRIAMVGVGSNVKVGGIGKIMMDRIRKIPGVRIVALCDPERAHLYPEVQKFKNRKEKCDAYVDIRKLLDSKDIDAIVVGTPNHWHVLAALWACQAGKDAFVQKPFSHNMFEGRKAWEAAQKYNRIVSATHGSRGRSGVGEAFAYARKGKLGKILYVRGTTYRRRDSIGKVKGPQPVPKTLNYDLWSGPAPILPVMREELHYDWHWIWTYGDGDLGNLGIHNLDACRWALGKETLPERVLILGGRFGYEDDGQTPNTVITYYDYKPAPVIYEVRGLPTKERYKGIGSGVVVHCEHGYIVGNKAYDNDDKLIREFEPTNQDSLTNFFSVVRSRKTADLQENALSGHLSACLVHMGNISYRIGKETVSEQIREIVRADKNFSETYDRFCAHLAEHEVDIEKHPVTVGPWLRMNTKEERFIGAFSKRANQLRSRKYRPPFVVPEKV
ncbi:MAG: Gfo/Idh/MocA family oxidoreductase [Planctomycetota bacterium]|jgi:predicted dehydrogenase